MTTLVGRICEIVVDGLTVQVHILAEKTSYGHLRYQIQPVAGSGAAWVDAGRVRTMAGVVPDVIWR